MDSRVDDFLMGPFTVCVPRRSSVSDGDSWCSCDNGVELRRLCNLLCPGKGKNYLRFKDIFIFPHEPGLIVVSIHTQGSMGLFFLFTQISVGKGCYTFTELSLCYQKGLVQYMSSNNGWMGLFMLACEPLVQLARTIIIYFVQDYRSAHMIIHPHSHEKFSLHMPFFLNHFQDLGCTLALLQ